MKEDKTELENVIDMLHGMKPSSGDHQRTSQSCLRAIERYRMQTNKEEMNHLIVYL